MPRSRSSPTRLLCFRLQHSKFSKELCYDLVYLPSSTAQHQREERSWRTVLVASRVPPRMAGSRKRSFVFGRERSPYARLSRPTRIHNNPLANQYNQMASVYKTERGLSKSPARLPACRPSFPSWQTDGPPPTARHRRTASRTQPALKIGLSQQPRSTHPVPKNHGRLTSADASCAALQTSGLPPSTRDNAQNTSSLGNSQILAKVRLNIHHKAILSTGDREKLGNTGVKFPSSPAHSPSHRIGGFVIMPTNGVLEAVLGAQYWSHRLRVGHMERRLAASERQSAASTERAVPKYLEL
ncbi:hypothetical protein O3P69_013182 [Scylla paramamosain]|uniref:Uncharacterized protein n=1 Tax=Scylla paramamosain TaxID=85552 RepID=A0AAW0U269_SCYPA